MNCFKHFERLKKQRETLTNLQSNLDDPQSGIYEPIKEMVEHDQEDNITEKELLQVKATISKNI